MNPVITISRQHGSGGRRVGMLLAQQLDIPFYDKDRLRDLAVESGLGKALLEAYGAKHAASLLYSLATSAYSFGYFDPEEERTIGQKAYLTAFDTVRKAADKGPCVIVGRCADYVLRDRAPTTIFIHAPLDYRAAALQEREEADTGNGDKTAGAVDHLRQSYYNYYTGKCWGTVDNYHLTVDSSLYGVEDTASFLAKYALRPKRISIG